MPRNGLVILALVTGLAVFAAAMVLRSAERGPEPETRAALYPGIAQSFDNVARLIVIDAEATTVLARAENKTWVLPEKANYPADAALVRRTILAFAAMTKIEEKTKSPELYERLGLRDPGTRGARGRLVTLERADGSELAALIIGDAVKGVSGTPRAYVRKAGEAQTWLADGVPEIAAKPANWVDDSLVAIDRERIKQIFVRHGDGETVRIFRTASDKEFRIADKPKGRAIKSYGGPAAVAGGLAFLTFDDVRAGSDPIPASPQTTAETEITTFDGLTLRVTLRDGWAEFSAKATTEATAAEAEGINRRFAAWAYKLPLHKLTDLAPRMDDLVEPIGSRGKR